MYQYGEEALEQLLSRMCRYSLLPEIMVETICFNVEVWIDNFLKKEYSLA